MKINFNGEELTGKLGQYEDGQKHLQLFDADGLPYMTVSVNFMTTNLKGYNITGGQMTWTEYGKNVHTENTITIKNYSENEGIEEAMIKAGLIHRDQRVGTFYGQFVTLNVYEVHDFKFQ